MTPQQKKLLELNFATFISGFTGLFAKIIILPVVQIVFWRMFLASFALAAVAKFRKRSFSLKNKKTYLALSALGILMALHWICTFMSFRTSSIAVAITSIFTYPLISALLQPFFFKKRLDRIELLLALCALLGVFVSVGGFDFNIDRAALTGALWGIASAILFAVRNLIVKKHYNDIPGSVSMTYQCFFGALFMLLVFANWQFESHTTLGLEQWLSILALGWFFTALTHTLLIASLSHLSPTSIGIISSLQIVYAIFFAWLFLSEYPSQNAIFGALIIVSTTAIENMRQSSSH